MIQGSRGGGAGTGVGILWALLLVCNYLTEPVGRILHVTKLIFPVIQHPFVEGRLQKRGILLGHLKMKGSDFLVELTGVFPTLASN